MAVPKKKTSVSKRGLRRSHHAITAPNIIKDKDTGEYKLSHREHDGRYNGRQVIKKKKMEE